MEIIQEIGSYAGLAAVVGLAVLSALYFSQARDVRRLREWAGRAPERTEVPQTTQPRVIARPVPKPPEAAPVPTPAAAAAAGAAPAVAAATPAAARAAGEAQVEEKEAAESSNGTEESAPVSQDTVVHPPPTAPADEEDGKVDEGGPDELEPADEDSEDVEPEDPGAAYEPPPMPPPLPPARPTIPIGAGASGRPPTGSILPPYEEIRPGAPGPRRRSAPGGLLGTPRRAVAVVGGSLLAIAVIAFGVLQLTGGDDAERPAASQPDVPAEDSQPDTPSKQAAGVDRKSVTVAVLNGTTVPGLAAQIGDTVERRGYSLGTVTNFIDQQRAESVVKYAPGAEREAADVGRRLKIAQREPIDAESQGIAGDATVVVVVGADKTQ